MTYEIRKRHPDFDVNTLYGSGFDNNKQEGLPVRSMKEKHEADEGLRTTKITVPGGSKYRSLRVALTIAVIVLSMCS